MDNPADPAASLSRRLTLVGGPREALDLWVAEALAGLPDDDILWVGDEAVGSLRAVPHAQVTRHLGSETRLLVFNAYDGFDPDAFAAAVGTLRGGGDCVVLAPPLPHWPRFNDPYHARMATYPWRPGQLAPAFLERLVRTWCEDPRCRCLDTSSDPDLRLAARPTGDRLHLNREQQALIEQIVRVACGHARRPLLLSADRGRGKSTVLAYAAARLLGEGRLSRITVVAPHRRAVETLFVHARREAGLAPGPVADLVIAGNALRFRLPHDCLSDAEDPGLLLVDEAAALSVGVLQGLLTRANRLVFATTEQGYEGSGRGFRLRFEALVRERMPQFRRARLEQPVRWAADDALEALVGEGLLLNTEAPDAVAGALGIEKLSSAALRDDERLLRGVFGLLIGAHYQTRPSDLRRLLDDPGLVLWVAFSGASPCGVLLGTVEGGFDGDLVDSILAGRRRPRGHLLAQSLAVHAGRDAALVQRTFRIMRVAVHQDLRRRGIGSRLLETAAQWAASEGLDGLGCAYAIASDLLAFWMSRGLKPVRLGLRIDPASAAHTVMMLRGLSDRGRGLAVQAVERFRRDLPWSLGDVSSDLPVELAIALLRGRDCADLPLDEADLLCLDRIASGARDPASASPVVWRWLVHAAASGEEELQPLIARYLQHRPVAWVCEAYGIAGPAALARVLRERLAGARDVPGPSG
jgi:tRNA(Met) cytidine acetyltransferase